MNGQNSKNVKIAEFMGLDILYGTHVHHKTAPDGMATSMKYHDSWDWLLPVVKKIRSLNSDPEVVPVVENINYNIGNDFIIEVYKDGLETIGTDRENYSSDLAMVYDGVLLFIDWYNKNK